MHDHLHVLYPNYPPGVMANCTKFPTLHVSASCYYPGLMVEVGEKGINFGVLAFRCFSDEKFGFGLF
jgi:hypothetical protein